MAPVFSPEIRVPSAPESTLIGPKNASSKSANPIKCEPASVNKSETAQREDMDNRREWVVYRQRACCQLQR